MKASTGYDVSETDTAVLPASDRRDFWCDHVRANHGGLESRFDRAEGFTGKTVVQRSVDFQLMEFSSDAVEYERRQSDVRRDDDRSLRVLIPRAGLFRIGHGQDRDVIGPGSAVALSMSSPFTLGHGGDARAWVVSVPESSSTTLSCSPRMLDMTSGVGAVASAMLRQLSIQRNSLSTNDFREIGKSVTILIATLGSDVGRWPGVAQSAFEYVHAQSDDPTLTPVTLARRLGWSVRHIQAVLASVETTPSDLIRTSRLNRAKARLDDPAQRHRSITEVAYASGFGSVSTFNSAFRAEFGFSPSDSRSARVRR